METRRSFLLGGSAALATLVASGKPIRSSLGADNVVKGVDGWSNPYVTDGLIAMWDGIWNVGGGVHDAGSSVWKDLVGSNDMSLSASGITFGQDSIVCEQGGYAAMADSIPSFMTMEAVLSFDSSGGGRIAFSPIFTQSGYYNDDRWIAMRGNGTVNFCGNGKFIEGFGIGLARSVSCTYLSAQASYDNDVTLVFLDGLQTPISNTTGGYGFGVPRCNGVSPQSSYYFAGKIHNVRLYSRALDSDEIESNYLVDKERFGLP